MLLKILLPVLISALIFVLVRFVHLPFLKKQKTLEALFFSLALLFGLFFLFQTEIAFDFRVKLENRPYLLIDVSESCVDLENEILRGLIDEAGKSRTYYFSDRVSQNPQELSPQKTALFDSLKLLQKELPENARVLLYSDCNDNDSLSEDSEVFITTVLLSDANQLVPKFFDTTLPELIEAEEKTDFEIEIVSPYPTNLTLTLFQDDAKTATQSFSLEEGKNSVEISHVFSGEGFRTLSFKMGNESLTRMAYLSGGFYSVMLAAGRPSEEFAAVKRFLQNIRYIDLESQVLISKEETLDFSSIGDYDGLLLMDVTSSQIEDFSPLKNFDGKIFYSVGLQSFSSGVLLHFTNLSVFPVSSSKNFEYQGKDLTVDTAYDADDILIKSENLRIFFGWNSWKWDFRNLPLGYSENAFDSFWKNQVSFLIENESVLPTDENLNRLLGEDGLETIGKTNLLENGESISVWVDHNPRETGKLNPDFSTASALSESQTNLSEIEDAKAFYRSFTGDERISEWKHFSLNFAESILTLIGFFVFALLFWIFSDIWHISS